MTIGGVITLLDNLKKSYEGTILASNFSENAFQESYN